MHRGKMPGDLPRPYPAGSMQPPRTTTSSWSTSLTTFRYHRYGLTIPCSVYSLDWTTGLDYWTLETYMGIDSLKEGGVSENSHVGLVESVNCHLSLHLSNPYCICSSTTYIIDTCSINRLHAIRISKLPHLLRV